MNVWMILLIYELQIYSAEYEPYKRLLLGWGGIPKPEALNIEA